jgi:CheY-specific phosphatase CheX
MTEDPRHTHPECLLTFGRYIQQIQRIHIALLAGVPSVVAQVDAACVIKANAQFWEQMLAMNLGAAPLLPEDSCLGTGHFGGSVNLSGNWNGRIELRMSCQLAYLATSTMMMQPPETVAEADALDAVREIVNMIAGVIKSSLPRPCSMTVPESAVVPESWCIGPSTEDSLVVVFRHATGDLMVRVWEQNCVAP